MLAKRLNPILNVSNVEESFSWFERLGGRRRGNGARRQISEVSVRAVNSSCVRTRRVAEGRARSARRSAGKETTRRTKGCGCRFGWTMSMPCTITALSSGLSHVALNMPWNVREMHVRHPDGHVFRISRGLD